MEKRFLLFLVISFCIIAANAFIQAKFFPPVPVPPAKNAPKVAGDKQADEKKEDQKKGDEKKGDDNKNDQQAAASNKEGQTTDKPTTDKPATDNQANAAAEQPIAEEKPIEPKWYSLGSLDPTSPYRMLVCLTSKGAAIERLELSSPRFRDIQPYPGYSPTGESDRSGCLGYMAETDELLGAGCHVNIIGAGTPAAEAGLAVGDVITAFDGKPITGAFSLHCALAPTHPGEKVQLTVLRTDKDSDKEDKTIEFSLIATLAWRPVAVLHAEKDGQPLDYLEPGHDQLSLLTTLQQVDSNVVTEGAEEIKGISLRSDDWEVLPGDEQGNNTQSEVRFRRAVPAYKLEFVKHYKLVEVPAADHENATFKAYHLAVTLEVRNLGSQGRQIAYRLDGPTGLPVEGWWYAAKVTSSWGAVGLRDVMVQFEKGALGQIGGPAINAGKDLPHWTDQTLEFLAVDAQYFAAGLLPQNSAAADIADAYPMLVGKKQEGKRVKISDNSFRIISKTFEIGPQESLHHEFQFFAGPKRPNLLEQYGSQPYQLDSLVSYGWFPFVAKPMLWLLHSFYGIVRSYGIAILMLTVLVRMCLFPISRKQALGAQKMQELQPEMKRIKEKHKGDSQAVGRATQDLFKKHNYNPLGGCMLVFLQFPIFVGLYNSLRADVELRQAPFFTESIRWCSNLAAPDMLYNWISMLPAFLTAPIGFLGPYLNILPLIAVSLMILQQKMFMPPATDEQTQMQQSMMKYMMVFVGVMFYWVASGLCLYFIASSLWSITEKKLLPRTLPGGARTGTASSGLATFSNGNAAAARQKKKQRRK